jgi:hypothetical protein
LVPYKTNLNFDEQVEDKPEVKEEIPVEGESNQPFREDSTVVSKVTDAGIILTEKTDVNKMDKLANAAKTQRDAGIILTEKTHSSVPDKDANKMDKLANAAKTQSCVTEKDVNKLDKPTNATSRSPQRRKVLKTRIDERGREGIPCFLCLGFQRVVLVVCQFAS